MHALICSLSNASFKHYGLFSSGWIDNDALTHINATGISCLVKGKWPLFAMLVSSNQQGLNEETCLRLGVSEADRSRIAADKQADLQVE